MLQEFNRHVARFLEAKLPFVVATVVRVKGSASARPGSKALIDAHGRNVFGWVGGGCAESLVREEALKALQDRRTRIVDVDLEDEVLGVGMPCGGRMDVYLEPHLPPRPLIIAGSGTLARQLAALGGTFGYDVSVHGPKARTEHFPTTAHVNPGGWDTLEIPPGASVILAAEHDDHLPALRRILAAPAGGAQPGSSQTGQGHPSPALPNPGHLNPNHLNYLGLVASRRISQALFKRLRQEGVAEAALGAIRTPAGLDLGGDSLEEMALSILAELLACERGRSAYPLRVVKGLLPVQQGARPQAADSGAAAPDLLIVGHGRIAEELARLGTLMRWRVTVNSPQAEQGDFPATSCLVTTDLDFSGMTVTPSTYVVVATMHKGDHLSMQKVLMEGAAYIGLVASRKRAGLVLDFLKERGIPEQRMGNVHAPAGLDLGAADPAEIALSIMSEVVAAYRGGSCRPLRDVEAAAGSASGGECLHSTD